MFRFNSRNFGQCLSVTKNLFGFDNDESGSTITKMTIMMDKTHLRRGFTVVRRLSRAGLMIK